MSKFTDHYFILGVNENATVMEITSAYKRQCFRWHPDRNPGVEATTRMQEINEAKRILSDNGLREAYNNKYRTFKAKLANQNKNKGENSKGDNVTPKAYCTCNLKTDNELINICTNAAKYKLEYIHTVLQELKKRNYSLNTINEIIRSRKTKAHR